MEEIILAFGIAAILGLTGASIWFNRHRFASYDDSRRRSSPSNAIPRRNAVHETDDADMEILQICWAMDRCSPPVRRRLLDTLERLEEED